MSAPLIWILVPAVLGGAMLFLRRWPGWVAAGAAGVCLLLALLAWQLPADGSLHLGPLSLQISPVLVLFGRRFALEASDRPFLVLMYLFGSLWIFGTRPAGAPALFPPLGLLMIALVVAAQAVEPFLYAALIIEMVVLLSLPLLAPPGRPAGAGALRYLVFQTMAVPVILLAGWAAGQVEANPPGTRWVIEAAIFLALGFSIWLAVFPFHTWVPLLAQDTAPYIFGFLLGLLPVGILFIFLGFLDSYTWMRTSPLILEGLRLAGGLMILTSGIWAAFQNDMSRLLGYAILITNGFAMLSIGLGSTLGIESFVVSLVPRLLALALASLSVSVLQKNGLVTSLAGLAGALRRYPFAVLGLVTALFSLSGLPLLASFPIRQPLYEALAVQSLPLAVAVGLGNFGFFLGIYRLLVGVVQSDEAGWKIGERLSDIILLTTGLLALLGMGILPGVFLRASLALAQIFPHLR